MADSDRMPRVDLEKDASRLSQSHLDYIRKIEKKNLERVRELKNVRKRNLFTGLLLAGGVFGIYFYSMFAVKQETFLDDFDEPVNENVSKN